MMLLQVGEAVGVGKEIADGKYNPNWILVIFLIIFSLACLASLYLIFRFMFTGKLTALTTSMDKLSDSMSLHTTTIEVMKTEHNHLKEQVSEIRSVVFPSNKK